MYYTAKHRHFSLARSLNESPELHLILFASAPDSLIASVQMTITVTTATLSLETPSGNFCRAAAKCASGVINSEMRV
jgi:hypothetical protein